MTIPSEEGDAPSGAAVEVEQTEDGVEVNVEQNVEQEEDAETSSPSKLKDDSAKTTEGSDQKNDGVDAATISSTRSKSKKKKKKKVSRDDSNSGELMSAYSDDKSNSELESGIISTTSSKVKKKKKKKTTETNDESESVDVVSLSSKKSPQAKKKKKKKISREPKDDDSRDGTADYGAQSVTSSVRSKKSKSSKSPKSGKPKKKKSNGPDESEHTIPETQESLEASGFANDGPKRTMSMDSGRDPNFMIKRTMSLDTANNQFQRQYSNAGRMNNSWGGRGRGPPPGRGRGPPGRGRGPPGRGRGPPPAWASRSMRPPDRMPMHDALAVRASSHERMQYGGRGPPPDRNLVRYGSYRGERSMSHHERTFDGSNRLDERSQYGSPRGGNGRGRGPQGPHRGRRPMSPPGQFNGGSPTASGHSRGNMYNAPGRPRSILRNSNHNGMSGSSHHKSIGTNSSHSTGRRVNIDMNSGSRHSTRSGNLQSSFGSEIDSSDIESDVDDDESSFAMEDYGERGGSRKPPSTIDNRSYSRSLSGLGTNSSHHPLSTFKAQSQSTRSLLTIERAEFQNENKFISMLRYIHLLPPHPNEDPIKKKIRIITWCALFCDFMNALVAIITWQGETTKCCGQSIFMAIGGSGEVEDLAPLEADPITGEYIAGGGDGSSWDLAIEIVTYLYMLLIFLEVVPVMRDRFPFNLLNPFIGFLITFAVFFSDSIVEAASMWVFEALAVTCEGVNYRLRLKRFAKRKERLKNTKKEIEKLRKIKRKVKDQYDSNGGRLLTRADSVVLNLDDSESSFAEDSSFNDDMETNNNSGDLNTIAGRTAVTNVSNIGTHRETRLLRERRQLIRSQAEDEQDLRVHFIGVTCNTVLVVISLLMIIFIAKNGGMCIVNMQFGNLFKSGQLATCGECIGDDGEYEESVGLNGIGKGYCEVCEDNLRQCYYPYGFGL